jgi:uncharacterized membrane protein
MNSEISRKTYAHKNNVIAWMNLMWLIVSFSVLIHFLAELKTDKRVSLNPLEENLGKCDFLSNSSSF